MCRASATALWLNSTAHRKKYTEFSVTVQGLSDSIVVEQYCPPKEYTEFGVTVLGTAMGPVALLPTEIASFDMSDDIAEADLDNEAYQARLEVGLLDGNLFWSLRNILCF